MRPNARRTTLADIAQAAGVSVATVSKVVNGRGDVAPHTRVRVQELLHRHDYLAPVFRHTEAVENPTIEVQFKGGLKSYVAETLEGIVDAAAESGASVVVSKASSAPHWARDLVSAGRRAVIAVTSVHTAAHLKELARSGLPLVVLDPLHLPDSRVHSVGATNFAGGLSATRHLLSLGHRRIAYLGGPAMAVCNQARMHGYRAAMEAEGAPVPEAYVRPGEFTYESGLAGAAELLDLDEPPPTAVFAGNDEIALGVVETARARGLRVPEDLSVVGFDDTSLAQMASPPLTTVRQPLREMGAAALRTALRLANGEKAESHHIELATELVVRASTAPPPEGG
ncbi:LacI family transcriptional regulator [Actinospica acidiphila]|nr:LacI family transcriptional regulator [Actinospica acidiphila]